MNWSKAAWEQVENRYQLILQMPFICELADGSLSQQRFEFYMAQDSLYLDHFGRVLSIIGARAHHLQDALSYIRFAENALIVESALHETYFNIIDKGEMQPACHHYVHFLKSTATLEPIEVAMAAVLPCFWIYKKVGDHIFRHQQRKANPYQKWIDTYSGDEFTEAVQLAIDICDKAAAQTTPIIRERMTEAFITASHLEYHFWDAAYHVKLWK